jgi:DNA-binding NtrC family response regulator
MHDKTILIVDDSNTSVMLMDYALKHAGYRTMLAYSVKEAFEQMKNLEPQLVILDLSMPEISGFGFLVMLKRKKLGHIPVVVISAHDNLASVKKSKELGAVEFIPKPVKIDLIIDRIGELIG